MQSTAGQAGRELTVMVIPSLSPNSTGSPEGPAGLAAGEPCTALHCRLNCCNSWEKLKDILQLQTWKQHPGNPWSITATRQGRHCNHLCNSVSFSHKVDVSRTIAATPSGEWWISHRAPWAVSSQLMLSLVDPSLWPWQRHDSDPPCPA